MTIESNNESSRWSYPGGAVLPAVDLRDIVDAPPKKPHPGFLTVLHGYKALRVVAEPQIRAEATLSNLIQSFAAPVAARANDPKGLVYGLANDVAEDMQALVLLLKGAIGYQRPSKVDGTLGTVIPVPGYSSYPGGHSAIATLLFLAFNAAIERSSNLPALASLQLELFSLSQRIGVNREIAGLHWAFDTVAGVTLAHVVHATAIELAPYRARIEAVAKTLS